MKKSLIEFNDQNFEVEVLKSESIVVVDFWADWCAPCRAVSPSIEKLASEFGDEIKFGKLDIDANPSTTAMYGISSIPAIVIFKDGQIIESLVGVRPYERYQHAVQQLATA